MGTDRGLVAYRGLRLSTPIFGCTRARDGGLLLAEADWRLLSPAVLGWVEEKAVEQLAASR